MKFENVKVGDIVYVEKSVNFGWRNSKMFFIPEKVIRVSKTQFVTESKTRYKKNGSEVGRYATYAYREGDKKNYFGGVIFVSDETKKMELFIHKLKLERDFNTLGQRMKVELDSDLTIEELEDMVSKAINLISLIEKKHETRKQN